MNKFMKDVMLILITAILTFAFFQVVKAMAPEPKEKSYVETVSDEELEQVEFGDILNAQ